MTGLNIWSGLPTQSLNPAYDWNQRGTSGTSYLNSTGAPSVNFPSIQTSDKFASLLNLSPSSARASAPITSAPSFASHTPTAPFAQDTASAVSAAAAAAPAFPTPSSFPSDPGVTSGGFGSVLSRFGRSSASAAKYAKDQLASGSNYAGGQLASGASSVISHVPGYAAHAAQTVYGELPDIGTIGTASVNAAKSTIVLGGFTAGMGGAGDYIRQAAQGGEGGEGFGPAAATYLFSAAGTIGGALSSMWGATKSGVGTAASTVGGWGNSGASLVSGARELYRKTNELLDSTSWTVGTVNAALAGVGILGAGLVGTACAYGLPRKAWDSVMGTAGAGRTGVGME